MATYKPLQSVSLTTTASSITFSGIDQGYTDLVVVSSIKVTSGTPVIRLLVNSDTNSNYSRTGMYGDGSTATGYKETSAANLQLLSIVDNFTPMTLHFANYSNITTNKAILMKGGITYPGIQAGLWRSTSAINALTLNLSASTFEPGSTFDLYGIKSGAPQALGGDTVTTDGNYWYHTFRSTQIFTPLKTLNVDYLVVAGGGGGGQGAGGGGAGGYRTSIGGSLLSVSSGTSYTVTVGAGGASSASATNPPSPTNTAGTDSIFSSITSTGGGRGGSYSSTAGGNGGSGGGGSDAGFGTASPAGQGNNGGVGNFVYGGGGGGAGAVGANYSGTNGGNGGNGLSNSISGSSVTYAGGGGGAGWSNNGSAGSGGTGGGGAGTNTNATATSGTTNTGGGGGAGGFTQTTPAFGTSGQGGSGIVIVRYAV